MENEAKGTVYYKLILARVCTAIGNLWCLSPDGFRYHRKYKGESENRMSDVSTVVKQAMRSDTVTGDLRAVTKRIYDADQAVCGIIFKAFMHRRSKVEEHHRGTYGKVEVLGRIAVKLPHVDSDKEAQEENCHSTTAEAMFMAMLQNDLRLSRSGLAQVFPRLL